MTLLLVMNLGFAWGVRITVICTKSFASPMNNELDLSSGITKDGVQHSPITKELEIDGNLCR